MAGRKTFTAGEVLQAADVNDFLMDQSVMVFAGTAARGSAIPSPSEGMVTYLEDADELQFFDGSSFTAVGVQPAILQVVSTTKSDTFSASVAAGGNSAVTGLSASITPSSTSSKILIHCVLGAAANNDGKNQVGLAIYDGSAFVDIAPSSGSRTSVTTGGQTSGTGATNSVTMPSLMLLDSPSTTSSITYSAYVINPRSGTQTLYVNRTEVDSDVATSVRAVSTITLMEVAG